MAAKVAEMSNLPEASLNAIFQIIQDLGRNLSRSRRQSASYF